MQVLQVDVDQGIAVTQFLHQMGIPDFVVESFC